LGKGKGGGAWGVTITNTEIRAVGGGTGGQRRGAVSKKAITSPAGSPRVREEGRKSRIKGQTLEKQGGGIFLYH